MVILVKNMGGFCIWSENNEASSKRWGIFMHYLFQVFKLCQQEQLWLLPIQQQDRVPQYDKYSIADSFSFCYESVFHIAHFSMNFKDLVECI